MDGHHERRSNSGTTGGGVRHGDRIGVLPRCQGIVALVGKIEQRAVAINGRPCEVIGTV